jgi:hypothetical protein
LLSCVAHVAVAAPDSGQIDNGLPALPAPGLSLDEVIGLVQQGQQAEAIITRIRATGSYYRLSAADVISLRERGLPLAVIDHILASERQVLVAGLPSGSGSAHRAEGQAPEPSQKQRLVPALYFGL